MTELINQTQLLVHRAQWELQEMIQTNKRSIELSEQMTALCDKCLDETDDKAL